MCLWYTITITMWLWYALVYIIIQYDVKKGFPDGSDVKKLPAVQEMQVQSLGQEDPLEKEMATHFSILAPRIPWTEEPVGLQSKGLQKVRHN